MEPGTVDATLLDFMLKDQRRSESARAATRARLAEKMDRLTKERLRGERLLHHWEDWVKALFAEFANKPFAGHHVEFWDWVWAIERNVRPVPFVAIWPRGGAKSSSAEMACVAIGARRVRRYAWYICESQTQADTHVQTIADLLESAAVQYSFPALAQRRVGIHGNSRGWRRNRLSTASGLTIDAIGLDTARRGSRMREARPDFMVFDDIDGRHDSAHVTEKKKEIITTSLLPAGSSDLAVLMVQNLIHPDSVFSQLSDGRAEFLHGRQISGPHKAVNGLVCERRESDGRYVIVSGEATWEGQPLEICEEQINEWGITAFEHEAQHEVDVPPGGIWDNHEFRRCTFEEVPDLVEGCVWVDPAVTETDASDSHGIQVDGRAADGRIYRLYSWEQITSPEDSIWRATIKALEFGFDTVGIETDQGGDTWRSVYRNVLREMRDILKALVAAERTTIDDPPEVAEAGRKALAAFDQIKVGQIRAFLDAYADGDLRFPRFKSAKAGQGHGSKVHRNQQMLADYERGRIVHVIGTTEVLEKALRRFPKTKPLDLADVAYWSWVDLRGKSKGVFF